MTKPVSVDEVAMLLEGWLDVVFVPGGHLRVGAFEIVVLTVVGPLGSFLIVASLQVLGVGSGCER